MNAARWTPDFLLNGANGYTGRLSLERALDAGLKPLPMPSRG